MKYCAMGWSNSRNFGDDIQTLAAVQFLPRVDHYVDRDNLWTSAGIGTAFLIANGWFMHNCEGFPPQPNIRPFYIGFHIANMCVIEKGAEHFKKYQPIGARNPQSMQWFQEAGVDAYFSNCLSLTFEKRHRERNDKIYLVDMPEGLVPENIEKRAIKLTHYTGQNISDDGTRRMAQELVDTYAKAKLVITTRLHCALPCLAFGTPVVCFQNRPTPARYDSVRVFQRVYDVWDKDVDWEPKPPDVSGVAEDLRHRCREAVREIIS